MQGGYACVTRAGLRVPRVAHDHYGVILVIHIEGVNAL